MILGPPRIVAAALALSSVFTFGSFAVVPAAHAAESSVKATRTIPVIAYDRYTLLNKVKTSNYTNKAQTLGDCLVTRAGSRCSIIKQTSATRSVGLALGASRGIISSSLNITGSTTESVSIQCTSPSLPANARYRAWPRGDRFTYRIKREAVVSGAVAATWTSGSQTAFNPKKNTITCG